MDMENGITKDESKAIAEFITEIYKFKIDNKKKFTYENAIISSLSAYEGQRDKKLIFEVSPDIWTVHFKFAENRPSAYWQVETEPDNIKNYKDIIQVHTRKGVVYLYNVRIEENFQLTDEAEQKLREALIEERECAVMKSEEIGEKFEEEFGSKSDYFNHRIGLFMEMKNWIVKQCEDAMLI